MLQASPWFTPMRTLAKTIHHQLGAHIMMRGMGTATSQPITRSGFRPHDSERRPPKRLRRALTNPKLTTKERITLVEAMANSSSASTGTTFLSIPTVIPTKKTRRVSTRNWPRLGRIPSLGTCSSVEKLWGFSIGAT